MKKLLISLAIATSALAMTAPAIAADDLMSQARELFKPIPETAPQIADNPLSEAKIKLGKMLFFDPRLSSSQLISCNTCHNIGMGGDDGLETSLGHGFAKGPRNAPTVFNAVFNIAQFWDGRAKDLKEQAKGPVQAGVEMNNKPAVVVATLKSIPEYVAAFKAAFPKDKDPVTFDNMARAIEDFEATLITPDSRFDLYLKGDAKALNDTEKKGLALFIEKGCAGCHQGVNIGGQDYYPFGVAEKPPAEIRPDGDKGRFKVTKSKEDAFAFRAGPLRNIALTAPYFHSGKVWSLEEAVAIMGDTQLGKGSLSKDDVKAITAFLKTLTGKQPKIVYPILPPSTDATPRPAR